jgi:hypothetical protein
MPGSDRTMVAALLLLLLLATGAAAGPNAADTKTIEACLKAATDQGASGFGCIGIIADPCIKKVSETDAYREASRTCAARELAVWSARLQRAVANVGKGGFKEVSSALAASQKSWSESLTRLCPVFEKLDPGMSLGGANYCRMQETAMRVLLLERLAEAVNPH